MHGLLAPDNINSDGYGAGRLLALPDRAAKNNRMSPSDDPRAAALLDAALAGARAIMAVYATDFGVERKADNSPVSEADRAAEIAVVARLSAAMPRIPIVAEEAAAVGALPAIGREFFLVDPLDGTKEFIGRNGEFTVNIALVRGGVPVLGVVLAPALGLAYLGGGRSAGAWKGRMDADFRDVRDWTPIATRVAPPAPVAVASRSHCNEATEQALLRASVGSCRSIGSSLKFCLLAEGEADFYPRLGPTMQWDTAAGDAVLRAAGGAVVTLDGRPLVYGGAEAAGLRPFENRHFLAVGDPALLARLDAARIDPVPVA